MKPHLIFLSETHLSVMDMELVKETLGSKHMYVIPSSGETSLLRGLAFLWSEAVTGSLASFSKYHIDLEVTRIRVNQQFRINGFYGDPMVHRTQSGWDKLKCLRDCSSLLWVCKGDFNEIMFSWKNGEVESVVKHI